jgi:hypothetical protein
VERFWQHHLRRLAESATIFDYIPLLAYRLTKEDLRREITVELGSTRRA